MEALRPFIKEKAKKNSSRIQEKGDEQDLQRVAAALRERRCGVQIEMVAVAGNVRRRRS